MAATRHSSFGVLLKRLRRAAGLTQEALAERAGYSAVYVGMLERGRRIPLAATVNLLADALDLAARDRALLHAAAARRAPDTLAASPLGYTAPSPLVGRAADQEALERHLIGDGPPVLLLAGEPGIGKTRLLAEAARQAVEYGWTVMQGGCQRRGGQEPYAPLLQAIELHLRRQQPARLRSELQGCAWLVRLLPELAELGLAPEHATLPPEQERRLMFGAVARLLSNAAGPAGTLLLLDDLQWAGADALDLLTSLVGAASAAPLRVVGAYRDTDVEPRGPLSSALADLIHAGLLTRRALGPLAPREAALLLDNLLADLPPDAPDVPCDSVLRRTGGVPFFLVSLAQALRSGSAGVEEPTPRQADGTVPWDLAQSLRQRLAALAPRTQELLDTAAVIGRMAPRRLLLAVLDWPEDEVLGALDVACRMRLLDDRGDAYQFTHDVIRETVEADLGAARRVALHRRVAEALEREWMLADEVSEPPVEALAYHYGRSGVVDKAVRYMEQAGDRARAQAAQAAAEGYYRELAERFDGMDRAAESARVREKLGATLATMARHDEALAVLERAAETYRAAGDLNGLARTMAQIGRAHASRGTTEEGVRRLQPLLPVLEASNVPHGLAALYTALAHLYFLSGRYDEQLAAAERAAQLAQSVGDDRILAAAEGRRGVALLIAGRGEEALPVLEHAIVVAEMVGDLDSLCRALINVGVYYFSRGEFERIGPYRQRALDAATRLGDPLAIARITANRGELAFYMGHWGQARADYEQALDLIRETGDSEATAYPLLNLAHLSLAEGKADEVARYADQALAVARPAGDLQALRWAGWLLAERDLLAGQPHAARARLLPLLDRPGMEELDVAYIMATVAWADLELGHAARAVEMAERAAVRAAAQNNRVVLVDALRTRALVAMRQGRYDAAIRDLEEGLALARRMPYPYGEARLLHAYGQLHVERGQPEPARRHLDEALALCLRLGAQGDAVRIRETIATVEALHTGGTVTDAQWARILALLPTPARTGRPRSNDRRALDAILYVQRTGCAWAALPPELGDDATAHRRLRQWQADGTWERIRQILGLPDATTRDAPAGDMSVSANPVHS